MDNITKLYDNLSYFDNYGTSVFLFFIITIIVFLIISYFQIQVESEKIKEDWTAQRCKPGIIPFAGLINKPDNMTIREYTQENFIYCAQNIFSNLSGTLLEPLTFITNYLVELYSSIGGDIQNSRNMMSKLRNSIGNITKEIYERLINAMIPIQQMVVGFRDTMAKIQGTLVSALFTLLGSYYTLQSLIGAVFEFILNILIAMVAIIFVLWIVPFTWGQAAAMTAIFASISIPLAILLIFMAKTLQVHTSKRIPGLKKPRLCFDKNTLIPMKDGAHKKIEDIQPGDLLLNGVEVTSVMKLDAKNSIMYKLYNPINKENDILVSDSHMVFYENKFIPVFKHPGASIYTNYSEKYIYCMNTSSKYILIDDFIFMDWDELNMADLDDLSKTIFSNREMIQNKYHFQSSMIHKYLDGGFVEYTVVRLQNGASKQIKYVSIGDILENGEKVCGIVKINGKSLSNQYLYYLGKNVFEGGPNLIVCEKYHPIFSTLELDYSSKSKREKKDILYNLITDKKTFQVSGIRFFDYDTCVELFLEKYKEKILSIKYV